MSSPVASLGDVLQAALRNIGHEIRILRQQAIEVWPDAVGDSLANHCCAVGWQGDALVVEVIDSVWLQELSLLQERLIAAVNARLSKPIVLELRFVVRSRSHKRRRYVRRQEIVPSDMDIELPKSLTGMFDAAADCRDPELGNVLARWLRRHFTRRLATAAAAGAAEQSCLSCGAPLAKSAFCPVCLAEWRAGGVRNVVSRLLAQSPNLSDVELRRLVPGCSARICRDVRETLVTQPGKVY